MRAEILIGIVVFQAFLLVGVIVTLRKQARATVLKIAADLKKNEQELQKANEEWEDRFMLRCMEWEQQATSLEHQVAFLRVILNHIPDLIYFKDPQGNYEGCNTAFEKLIGKKEAEILHHSESEVYLSEEAAPAWEIEQQVLQTDTPHTSEQWAVYPDGARKFLACVKMPIYDSRGELLGLLGISHDLTDHREHEEMLAQSEGNLSKSLATAQRYLDVAGVMLIVIQADHTISLINRMGCKILGYEEVEIIGGNWFELFVPEASREKTMTGFDRMVAGQNDGFLHYENAIQSRENGERIVTWHNIPIYDDDGHIHAVLCSGDDVTDQRRAESQNRNLVLAIEQCSVSVVITNRLGMIEYVNSHFKELTSYSNSEALDANLFTRMSEELPVEEYRRLWSTIHRGGRWQAEYSIRLGNGSVMWESASISPVTNENGAVTHFVSIFEDVTVRKQAEEALKNTHEQLEHTNLRLQEASLAKSQFLANMSHEIRTPLNAIIGMTGLMLDTPLTGEQQDYAETVQVSGEVLLALINDILDFSKIEAQKLDLESSAFNLRRCIEDALDIIAPKANEKNLEIAYFMKDRLPDYFIGDVTRLRQILVNLLTNAVKFTSSGEVVVGVSGQLQDYGMYQLRIAVRDTGIGIPPDRLDRLFQSFSQVDASTTRRFGGTGLGLAISKRLSEMMGGTIWVESSGIAGEGSTFTVSLLSQAAPDLQEADKDHLIIDLSAKTVLVVDDNKTNRQILVHQLLGWQMNPVAVSSGAEALDLLQQDIPFDLAILDMQMPEMDGATLAREIRHLKGTQELPLILLSSLGYQANTDEFLFTAHLTKPVKPSYLLECLVASVTRAETSGRKPEKQTHFDQELGQRHPLRILLAEDNLMNQKVALSMLGRMGYQADVVSNGLKALEAVEQTEYDVILMDGQMPEMDGETATQEIRKRLPAARQPHIVAMTANALQGDRERYLASGMNDYVSKPIKVEDLIRALTAAQSLNSTAKVIVNKNLEIAHETRVDVEQSFVTPVVDPKVLLEFKDMVGDETGELVREFVDLYLKDSLNLIEEMAQGCCGQDTELLRRAAHTLKGNSSQVGALRLAGTCFELEKLAKSGTVAGGEAIRQKIHREFSQVEVALRSAYAI